MKILFVDDDDKVLAMFRRNLSHRYAVEVCQDPLRAVENVSRGGVAVAVADLRMPGMDGFEFLAKVEEVSPLTVKIMLTGHADLESAIAGVNEGRLFRFLTKPCSTESLVRSLNKSGAIIYLKLLYKKLFFEMYTPSVTPKKAGW